MKLLINVLRTHGTYCGETSCACVRRMLKMARRIERDTLSAKRKTKGEYRRGYPVLPKRSGPFTRRYRAPHGPFALLPLARGERAYRAVARDASENSRSDGNQPGGFFPGQRYGARPRNAQDAGRTVGRRD